MKKLVVSTLVFSLAACSSSSTRVPSSRSIPIQVVGGDEASFTPPAPNAPVRAYSQEYDVVVVGAGLAGLSAAVFLSDTGKKVLVVEKEPTFGGLAAGTVFPGTNVRFDRGAAYWTSAYEEEQEILNHIGLGDYEKHAIPEPIDSYLWKGKLYPGIWEKETMDELPASFELFHSELKLANKAGLIPNQPFEEQAHLELDAMTAADWIRSMPAAAKRRRNEESRKIYARYEKELREGRLDGGDPMSGVIGLMDLYCRSALGTLSDNVSAVAFANFYISEIETRYTTDIGTGAAAEAMVKMLKQRPNVTLLASTPALKIRNVRGGVETEIAHDGAAYLVKSQYAVFAAQLKLAPKLIEQFSERAPQQAGMMADLGYSNYAVHAVEVKGHPYRATYDTWTRSADATNEDFTDVILGRWMEAGMKGYEGFRDFQRDPPGNSIMSIYHPLPTSWVGRGFTEEQAKATASKALDRMLELYNPLVAQLGQGQRIEPIAMQTSRWPFSVHVATPGHFSKRAKVMRKPFGRVFFGNNNLGTPAFEEALFRGHCAADNILAKMDSGFRREAWSKCPMEH